MWSEWCGCQSEKVSMLIKLFYRRLSSSSDLNLSSRYKRENSMEYKISGKKNDVALIITDEIVIKDTQSALDLIASAQYETDCDKIIVYKSCVADDFFVLSTGMAGEILQKFINYRKKIAIVGDYSKYTSKPLKDFIYESNNGNSIFFVSSIEEALLKLDSAK